MILKSSNTNSAADDAENVTLKSCLISSSSSSSCSLSSSAATPTTTISPPERKNQRKLVRFSSIRDVIVSGGSNNKSKNKNECKSDNEKITKKDVRFSPRCCIRKTIHLNNMTSEEIHATWFTQREQQDIRLRCKELAKGYSATLPPQAAGGDSVSSRNGRNEEIVDNACYRGLESYTPVERRRKRMIRYESVMAVLEEQEHQYNEEGLIYDEEQLAYVYQEVSLKCQFEAEIRALKDRKAVEQEQRITDGCQQKQQKKNDVVVVKKSVEVPPHTTSTTTTTDNTVYSPSSSMMNSELIVKTAVVSAAA